MQQLGLRQFSLALEIDLDPGIISVALEAIRVRVRGEGLISTHIYTCMQGSVVRHAV